MGLAMQPLMHGQESHTAHGGQRMELWLLGAGAIVLIAITLWIVWPSSTAEAVGTTTVPIEEERRMTEYTSPPADMSNSGVATAENMRAERHNPSHHWAPPG